MDLEESLAEDERAMARIASSFEVIADTLTAWYKLEAQRFDKDFPAKRNPLDATITRIASPEDALKEDQGATGELIDEWIGLREQELIDQPPLRTDALEKRRDPPKTKSKS